MFVLLLVTTHASPLCGLTKPLELLGVSSGFFFFGIGSPRLPLGAASRPARP
jgi:hypothetical protein